MISRGMTIRSRLLLTGAATVLLLFTLLLVYLDALSKLSRQEAMLEVRSEVQSSFRALHLSVSELTASPDTRNLSACLKQAGTLETKVAGIATFPGFVEDTLTGVMVAQIRATLARLTGDLHPDEISDPAWLSRVSAGTDFLGSLLSELDERIGQAHSHAEKALKSGITWATLAGILLIGTLLVLLYLRVSRALERIRDHTARLRQGELPPRIDSPAGDEFGLIKDNLNALAEQLKEKIRFISTLSTDQPVPVYQPGETDQLGRSLLELSKKLTEKNVEEAARNRADKRQNWVSAGMARLGEVLRSETGNVEELSFSIIQNLVKYMEVEMGSLYIASQETDGTPYLELKASYAFDRRKYRTGRLEWGEGLPGTCAREMKRIFLTEVPADYFEITSGTGSVKPNCLLIVPMIMNDQVTGIIELATIKLLRPFEIEFVESLAESFASTLMMVRNNVRNAELLQRSQAQATELQEKEDAMAESMKRLEEAREESVRKESELTGILNAMNQSVLVAEFGLNRRYTAINDPYLLAFESQRDQVLGKLHSEFADVDPYAEEYKSFWNRLKEGTPVSSTEKYKLFSGKEIWLSQTFAPIRNAGGQVYKILNIAVDITEIRKLQEELESSRAEIARGMLDMQTLNEAVNSSLIKCELDAEGIIMNVNDNYVQVTGYTRKELLGRNYRLFLQESEKEQFEKIWAEVAKQKVYEGVIRRSKPTGEETWLVSTFSPVVDESGVIYKVYLMGLDITEKKLKYQLLEEANAEIDRLRARISEMEV